MFCLNINHSFSFLVHISPSFPLELDPKSPGDMEDTRSRADVCAVRLTGVYTSADDSITDTTVLKMYSREGHRQSIKMPGSALLKRSCIWPV